MVNYKGKKYSVPTKYIGKSVNIKSLDDNNINIYYSNDLIVCHQLSDKKYNYKINHIKEILKTDAFKGINDSQIDSFIQNSMMNMDMILGD